MEQKNKTLILQSIFNEYNLAKEKLSSYTTYQSPLFIKEEAHYNTSYEQQLLHKISQMNHYREYIKFIDHHLSYLNETERLIIEHDFIRHSYKRWWESYFSSATYYRHRKKAVDHLMQMLFS